MPGIPWRYTDCVSDLQAHEKLSAAAAAQVKLLCLDVDGVLTDGSILIDSDGREGKRFNVRDGLGMRAWMKQGHAIAIVTGRGGAAVRSRMLDLGVSVVHEHVKDKVALLDELCATFQVKTSEVAFMGDDLPDLSILDACGYAMAPADACPEVRAIAAWTAKANGGDGAVREAIEHLLRARGTWDNVVDAWRNAAQTAGG